MNHRDDKLRKLARGQPCMLRLTCCNDNPETTVWAHLNGQRWGKGMSVKSHDAAGFLACNTCHDVYDRRKPWPVQDLNRLAEQAVIDTYIHLFREGLIRVV